MFSVPYLVLGHGFFKQTQGDDKPYQLFNSTISFLQCLTSSDLVLVTARRMCLAAKKHSFSLLYCFAQHDIAKFAHKCDTATCIAIFIKIYSPPRPPGGASFCYTKKKYTQTTPRRQAVFDMSSICFRTLCACYKARQLMDPEYHCLHTFLTGFVDPWC